MRESGYQYDDCGGDHSEYECVEHQAVHPDAGAESESQYDRYGHPEYGSGRYSRRVWVCKGVLDRGLHRGATDCQTCSCYDTHDYAGDRGALTLGESASRIRIVTLVLVSFLTASVVSYTGTIGFIGLVGPHVARIFVGSDNRYLIPASAAFGAAFILLADTVAKVSGANGLPVGVISSMIGGPLFIWILIRQRKSAWA